MKYLFTVTDNGVKPVGQADESAQIISQSTFPAREQREGYRPVLSYDEAQGIYWNYIALTGEEKREKAYQTEKCITFNGGVLTVDEANKLWQEYQAEGSNKAAEITALIATAKAEIRAKYPDATL